MTHDWRVVYLQEKRHPGYVIENGRSIVKTRKDTWRQPWRISIEREKRKTA
jgi:hypothetical protein